MWRRFMLVVVGAVACERAPAAALVEAAPAPGERPAPRAVMLAWAGQPYGAVPALKTSIVEVRGAAGRADVTSASYILREDLPRDRAMHVVETAEGEGQVTLWVAEAPGAEAVLTLTVPGRLDSMAFELAHGKVAVARWDGATPEVSVYDQRTKALVWSATVDAAGPLSLAWHPAGELTVELSGARGRERLVYDGATGATLRREELDARVAAALAAPVTYVLAAPGGGTLKAGAGELRYGGARGPGAAMYDAATGQELWRRDALCPIHRGLNLWATRVEELGAGLVLIAEATHPDSGRGVGAAVVAEEVRCWCVQIVDLHSGLGRGAWRGGR